MQLVAIHLGVETPIGRHHFILPATFGASSLFVHKANLSPRRELKT